MIPVNTTPLSEQELEECDELLRFDDTWPTKLLIKDMRAAVQTRLHDTFPLPQSSK